MKLPSPPVCWFGQRTDTPSGKAPGYDGLHHCHDCCAEVARVIARVREASA
jgi:hypothetical protein